MAKFSSCIPKLLKLSVSSEFDATKSCVKDQRVVLNGPNSSGKTSLLFEYAFYYAEKGDTVLYIAPKPLTRLPLFVNGRMQPNTEVLKRINIVYLSSYDDIIEYFSNVHLEKVRNSPQGSPRQLLFDDFDWYFKEKVSRTVETNRFAKCMAYIIDAVHFWSKMQGGVEGMCSIMFAETVTSDSMSSERIGLYKHWLKDFIKVQKMGKSLFRIQDVEYGENLCSFSSGLTLQYEIGEKGITVR